MFRTLIIYVLIPLLIGGCNWVGLENQRKYLDELDEPIPTDRELFFCDSLEQNGYSNVSLNIPIIGVVGSGESFYILQTTPPFELTEKNLDSVNNVNFEIARTLYLNVIEDSILNDLGTLEVIFLIRKSSKKNLFRLRRSYTKSDF